MTWTPLIGHLQDIVLEVQKGHQEGTLSRLGHYET